MFVSFRRLAVCLLIPLSACGGEDDRAPVPPGFPSAVEAAKAKAAGGDPIGAVEAYKALWTSFPDDVAREDSYKITLSLFDAVKGAPVGSEEKVDALIDVLQWAQAKHPSRADAFAARLPSVMELIASDDQRNRLKSNPYLGG